MSFDIVIPARYASSRLPGKPLIYLDGMSLIERVYHAACLSQAENVIIATDDERIKIEAERFGALVCMTSSEHASGTDRLAEVVDSMNIDSQKVLVNVQGDEPFIDPELIDQLAELLLEDAELNMSTACHVLDHRSKDGLEAVNNPNNVKVVVSDDDFALYFSRSPIPYLRQDSEEHCYYQHMGIYAYRAGFITKFSSTPMATLEQVESLEQLRVLQLGQRIKMLRYQGEPAIGIDTPEDVELALKRLEAMG